MPCSKRDAALLVALAVEQCAQALVDAVSSGPGAVVGPELEVELHRLQRELTHVHVLASREAFASEGPRCALLRRRLSCR